MIFSPTIVLKITHHVKYLQWILLAGQTYKSNLAKITNRQATVRSREGSGIKLALFVHNSSVCRVS